MKNYFPHKRHTISYQKIRINYKSNQAISLQYSLSVASFSMDSEKIMSKTATR